MWTPEGRRKARETMIINAGGLEKYLEMKRTAAAKGGAKRKGWKHTEETKRKISESKRR
jgi:hypothetical protein